MSKIEQAVKDLDGKWPEVGTPPHLSPVLVRAYWKQHNEFYYHSWSEGWKWRSLAEEICTYEEFMEECKRQESEKQPEEYGHNMTAHEKAWSAVVNALRENYPDWITFGGTGIENAVEAIEHLASYKSIREEFKRQELGENTPPEPGTVCKAQWYDGLQEQRVGPINVKIIAYDNEKLHVWFKTSYGNELVPVSLVTFINL